MSRKRESPGWNEWGIHVLEELKRLNERLETFQKDNADFKLWANREIAALQVKAGFFGAIGGVTTLVGAYLIQKLMA